MAACLVLSGCAADNYGQSGGSYSNESVASQTRRDFESASAELRRDSQPLISAQTVRTLENAEARYREIVAAGGWPTIASGSSFRPGDGDPRTGVLARRLAISMDLAPGPQKASDIAAALQRFQSRHGLKPTGTVDRATLEALNVPAERRLSQLRANIVIIRDLSQSVAPSRRYVLVNVPAFQLEAVEGQAVARRHRVVVGRVERPTPSVKALIRNVNFYPYWHVPESVARLDLIPHLQKDPEYLQRERIRVLRDWQKEELDATNIDWRSAGVAQLKFRQDPGEWNALGLVRIDMPNEHAVYMHDTPLRDLFGQRWRALSAGCVRVENVNDLVAWVLRESPGWDRATVDRVLAAGQPVDVALTNPVPVMFAYITAWADQNGAVEFRADIYGKGGADTVVASSAAGTGSRARLSP